MSHVSWQRGFRVSRKLAERAWERRYGSFQRAFTLPKSVAVDGVKADLDNGILTVRMPKAAEAKSRTIEIKGTK